MGFFGLVRSRRDADASTHALLLDSGFSAFPRRGRTLIPGLGFTKHCACAVGGASVVTITSQEWQGSRTTVSVLETVDHF